MSHAAGTVSAPTFRLLALALAALLAGGCTMPFLYRQLDWIIPWQLRSYVTLNAEQSSAFNRRLERLLDWHCATQLPQYALWLRQLAADPERFERAHLERHAARLTGYWDALSRRAAPGIAELLMTATPGQVVELFDNLEAKNREKEQEFHALDARGPDAVVVHRAEELRERIERWTGDLDERQFALLLAWSAESGSSAGHWIEGRRRWQAQLRSALTGDNPERRQRHLELLLIEPERFRSTEYRAWLARRQRAMLDLLARLGGTLSAEQQQRLAGSLKAMAADLGAIACRTTAGFDAASG